jgi:Mn-dependent DtxR family transcriptional regulator
VIVIPGDPPLALVAPDLTPTQARWLLAVAWLQNFGPVTLRKLAGTMKRSFARSQQMTHKLEKKEYLSRDPWHAGTIRLAKPLLWRECS